jgi:hypothetical protein
LEERDYDPRELRQLAATIYGSVSEAQQVHSRKLRPDLRDPLIVQAVEESVFAAQKILEVTARRVAIVPAGPLPLPPLRRTITIEPIDPPEANGSGAVDAVTQARAEHERRLREEA